ncbi:YY1-associated factor 2-like [Octopus bimaculoides]|nr:YY1-associated factor 2-like [Octopus bimaculoides]
MQNFPLALHLHEKIANYSIDVITKTQVSQLCKVNTEMSLGTLPLKVTASRYYACNNVLPSVSALRTCPGTFDTTSYSPCLETSEGWPPHPGKAYSFNKFRLTHASFEELCMQQMFCPLPPRLKNIDRSSATHMSVTVGSVTVVITDYQPKKDRRSSTDTQNVSPSDSSDTSSPTTANDYHEDSSVDNN